MPTNQMERECGVMIHPSNGTRFYSRAYHINCLMDGGFCGPEFGAEPFYELHLKEPQIRGSLPRLTD